MLPIPTVTQDDLDAFHARVFGSVAPPAHLWSTGEDSFYGATHDYLDHENEDDLGYYPDGNKRTLTDDQIAMFRHSEIYSILRERQVGKENREADGDQWSEGEIPRAEKIVLPQLHINDEGKVQSGEDVVYSLKRGEEFESQDTTNASFGNKRKRHRSDLGNTREPTHRRVARELDSAVADDQVLDYGDESTAPPEPNVPRPELGQEADTSNAEEAASDNDAGGRAPNSALDGKKIWWPVLGT